MKVTHYLIEKVHKDLVWWKNHFSQDKSKSDADLPDEIDDKGQVGLNQ